MFNFKKKEKMSEEEKNVLKRVMMFYEMNKDFLPAIQKQVKREKLSLTYLNH